MAASAPARPRDNSPDLPTLQQLANEGGALTLEVNRMSGNMLEFIWRGQGLEPQQVHNFYPTLQGYAGGGDYVFKVTAPGNPSLRPFEWTRRIPGTIRKPVDVAIAEAAQVAQMGPAPGQIPAAQMASGQTVPLPQWNTAAQPPMQMQPQMPPPMPMWPSMPMMNPWSMMGGGMMGGMGGGMGQDLARQQLDELRRQQADDRHRAEMEKLELRARDEQRELMRRLDEMEKRHQQEKQESVQVAALREIGEKLKAPDAAGAQTNLLASLFGTIAESNKSNVEQIRLAAQAAIEAGRTDKQQPYVDTMIKHLLEQSSPRAVAEMAATSGEIMTSAMSMMAQAVASAGGGDGSDAKTRMLMEAFNKVGQIAAGLVGGQAAAGAEARGAAGAVAQPPPQPAPVAPQLTEAQKAQAVEAEAKPAASGTDAAAQSADAKRSEADALLTEDLKKIVANLRAAVLANSITPDSAATALADVLYRYYIFGVDARLIIALVKDAAGVTAKLFPDWTPDQRAGFVSHLLPAATKVGFKPDDLAKIGTTPVEGAAA